MPYNQICKEDPELGSGAVESAVEYSIGKRCDHGGMRWIEECAAVRERIRIVHISPQRTHVHLLIEAENQQDSRIAL